MCNAFLLGCTLWRFGQYGARDDDIYRTKKFPQAITWGNFYSKSVMNWIIYAYPQGRTHGVSHQCSVGVDDRF